MPQEIHVDDVGTIFRITLMDGSSPVDLTGATAKSIIFEKPDKTSVSKDADFYTDGADGIIEYTIETDDLDMAGSWRIQAQVTLTSGTWSSDILGFVVHENIEVSS